MKTYLPRIVDQLLQERLEAKGAVLLEGPKWCGKTTSAKQIAGSFISMDQPDMTKQYQSMEMCIRDRGYAPQLDSVSNRSRHDIWRRGRFTNRSFSSDQAGA